MSVPECFHFGCASSRRDSAGDCAGDRPPTPTDVPVQWSHRDPLRGRNKRGTGLGWSDHAVTSYPAVVGHPSAQKETRREEREKRANKKTRNKKKKKRKKEKQKKRKKEKRGKVGGKSFPWRLLQPDAAMPGCPLATNRYRRCLCGPGDGQRTPIPNRQPRRARGPHDLPSPRVLEIRVFPERQKRPLVTQRHAPGKVKSRQDTKVRVGAGSG